MSDPTRWSRSSPAPAGAPFASEARPQRPRPISSSRRGNSVVSGASAWVSQVARDERIDSSILATRADIVALLAGDEHARLASGWRSELLGAGIRKLVAPEFTAYLRPSPARLIVTDESLIPPEFWVEQRPRLDRQSLWAAVKSGREVRGAVLANPDLTLAVRSQ